MVTSLIIISLKIFFVLFNLDIETWVKLFTIIVTSGGSAFFTYIAVKVRTILNRITLAEFKHSALMHAMNKQYKNGFIEDYNQKLSQLKSDKKFKEKGE